MFRFTTTDGSLPTRSPQTASLAIFQPRFVRPIAGLFAVGYYVCGLENQVLPLIALLFFTGKTPDPSFMKETAAKLREMTAAEVEHYETASSAHLVLVNRFRLSLRTWIEPQLPPPSATNEDCAHSSAGLIASLRDAGVLAPDPESQDFSINLSRPPEYPETLLLKIDIDLPFGADGAAYLYSSRHGRWERALAFERKQNRIGNMLNKVAFSPAEPDGSHLLLTLVTPAVNVGCVHGFGYSLYRVGPKIDHAVEILSRGETSDVCAGAGDVTMEPDGFRIDYTAITQDADRRAGVVRYRVRGDKARRVAPVALRPQDFVDEWVQRDWHDAQEWSVGANQKNLRTSHEVLHRMLTEYPAVGRCGETDRWQVTVNLFSKDVNENWYLLIRQSVGQQYEMLAVSRTPQPGCQ